MKTKNITANGEFVFIPVPETANTDVYPKLGLVDAYWPIKGKEYNEENYLSVIIPQGNYETIGYCSEIIKDEELAKRVVETINGDTSYSLYRIYKSNELNGFSNYSRIKSTESFASLLQANDIDLKVGGWLLIKKV